MQSDTSPAWQAWFDSQIRSLNEIRGALESACARVVEVNAEFRELDKYLSSCPARKRREPIWKAESERRRRLIANLLADLLVTRRTQLESLLEASSAWIPRSSTGPLGGPPDDAQSWCAHILRYVRDAAREAHWHLPRPRNFFQRDDESLKLPSDVDELRSRIYEGLIADMDRCVPPWLDAFEKYEAPEESILAGAPTFAKAISAIQIEALGETDGAIAAVKEQHLRLLMSVGANAPSKANNEVMPEFSNSSEATKQPPEQNAREAHGIEVDWDRLTVSRPGYAPVEIRSLLGLSLISEFAKKPSGDFWNRDDIEGQWQSLGGRKDEPGGAVDNAISNLRKQIAPLGLKIENVPRLGWKLKF